MRPKRYDPLDFVPSPQVARQLLAESQALTRRLEILVHLSDQLHSPDNNSAAAESVGQEASSCPT